MAIDKILGNGALDQVADSVFSAVSDSVSEIKAMQKRKAAENVQVVIQALKKIESDLQDKYDGVTTVLEKRVASIKDGKDGQNGVDGRAGKDGRPGRDGAVGPRGANGIDGRNGRDGTDGVSVTNANIDFDGSLIISLSNGRTINVGEVVAPDLAERIKVITNGGGTSQGVLDTLTSLQNQINALVSLGAVTYEGTWNASTNTPTIVAGTGNKGEYYVVSVAGNTSIDGETLWGVGDWIIFNGAVWQKVDGGSTGDLTSLTVRDNTTLGSSNTDDVTFNARIASEFTPATNNTYDLGRNSHEWRNLYLSGTANLSGGTANGVAYLNGSKVLTTGSALTFDGTQTKLTANPPTLVFNSTVNNSARGLLFENSGTQFARMTANFNNGDFRFVSGESGQSGYFFMWVTDGSEQMRLTNTGLGIGTSSPSLKLDVNGSAKFAGSYVSFNDNGYIRTDAANILRFQPGSGGYEFRNAGNSGNLAVLDSSGNLGLGVTPSVKLHVGGSGSQFVRLETTSGAQCDWITTSSDTYFGPRTNTALAFQTNNAERARITSGGDLLVGKTSAGLILTDGFEVSAAARYMSSCSSVAGDTAGYFANTAGSGARYLIRFYGTSTEVGRISHDGTNTTYATSSDYRLKNTIAPMTGALAKVALLKPCTYKWNADGSDGEGFIAHELAEVVPQCVTGAKDAVDAEGKPQYQGIDTSFLVATLTAALQELNAKFDAYVATHP